MSGRRSDESAGPLPDDQARKRAALRADLAELNRMFCLYRRHHDCRCVVVARAAEEIRLAAELREANQAIRLLAYLVRRWDSMTAPPDADRLDGRMVILGIDISAAIERAEIGIGE